MKTLLEFGPLLAFFAVYYLSDPETAFYSATAVLIVACIITLVLSRVLFGNFPMMTLVSTLLVVLFGGLTLALQDKTFIKMKPTIVYLLFAGVLGVGLYLKRPLIKYVIGQAVRMSEDGWTALTVRWTLFFVAMAVLNEIIWRNFSEGFWVNFKVFGALPLTLLFGMLQIPLMQRHGLELVDETKGDASETDRSQS